MTQKPPSPSAEEITADLCLELSSTMQHHSYLYDLRAPKYCHVIPQSLLAVLASVIALNFDRKGHAELVKSSAERLQELVDEAYKMSRPLSAADRAKVNPMAPCSCGPEASDGEFAELAAAVAAALGVPADAVKAFSVSGDDPAVRASDDPANMAGVAADVAAKLEELFGKSTKH